MNRIYIVIAGQSVGPLSFSQFQQKLLATEIAADTPACMEGSEEWVTAQVVAEHIANLSSMAAAQPGSVPPVPLRSSMMVGRPSAAIVPAAGAQLVAVGAGSSLLAQNPTTALAVREPGRKRKFPAALVVLVVLLLALGGAGVAFREPLKNIYTGYTSHARAEKALQMGSVEEALQFSAQACHAAPGKAAYQLTWEKAQEQAVLELAENRKRLQPIQFLALCLQKEKTWANWLQPHYKSALADLRHEAEPAAVAELDDTFDTTKEDLDTLMASYENMDELFLAPERVTYVRKARQSWKNLQDGFSAWSSNNYAAVAQALSGVADIWQKAVFLDLQAKLDSKRASLEGICEQAMAFAAKNDFLKAKEDLRSVMGEAGWFPKLQATQNKILLAGEVFYLERYVEAISQEKDEEAVNHLQSMLKLIDRAYPREELLELTRTTSFSKFLQGMRKFKLAPESGESRKNFIDVKLVATRRDNFSEQEQVETFLRDSYLGWAKRKIEQQRHAEACYLALLAKKYGADSEADEIVAKLQEDIARSFMVKCDLLPAVEPPQGLSPDFSAQYRQEMAQHLRQKLPNWMVINEGEADEGESDFHFDINCRVVSYTPRQQKFPKKMTKSYLGPPISVDNPSYASAKAAVAQAEAAVQRAQSNLSVAQSNYQTAQAQANASSYGGGDAGMFGALISTMTTVVSTAEVDSARSSLSSAQHTLGQARARLAQTPAQVSRENRLVAEWTETTHVNEYEVVFEMEFIRDNQTVWEESTSATYKHSAVEIVVPDRAAGQQVGIMPKTLQLPDKGDIEIGLINNAQEALKQMVDKHLHDGVRKTVGFLVQNHPSSAVDAEFHRNLELASELLWLNTRSVNLAALQDNRIKALYGDVIDL